MIRVLFCRWRHEADAEVGERVRSKFRCASGVNGAFCVPSLLKWVQKAPCALSESSSEAAPVLPANTQPISMGKELGRGREPRLRGGFFPMHYFKAFLNVVFQRGKETDSHFITYFLSLGFSLGYEPNELKKTNKWLPLE